jgi:hypothetical protein
VTCTIFAAPSGSCVVLAWLLFTISRPVPAAGWLGGGRVGWPQLLPEFSLPPAPTPIQVRKARTGLDLASSELEDRQRRTERKEARAVELETQVRQ